MLNKKSINRIKKIKDFKILLLYPNLSMLFSPPLGLAIFTTIFRQKGYSLDIFDATPYVGEGASAMDSNTFELDQDDSMNSIRKNLKKDENITFQIKSTEENMSEMMQSRPFSFEEDLGIEKKRGLYDDFVKKIDECKPDLILCSTVEDTFSQAIKLISLIRDRKIPVLFGGVFITSAPDLAMTFSDVKMLAIGEGENTVLQVAERIRLKESCEDIPGIWLKNENNKIIKNPRGPVVLDFMNVIPDYSLFESGRFYRQMGGRNFKSVTIESYRGCPYTCAYCNSPMQLTLAKKEGLDNFIRRGQFHKYRDYLLKVIETVQPTYFMFADDSFLARPKKEIEEFCKMYDEFKIPFWFNTRPENVTVENLKMLKEVNCHRMAFGIECGNEEFRSKVLLRNTKNKHIIDKFQILANGEIPYSINNIIGFPDETRDLIFETIELNRCIEAYDAMSVNVFVPYHGTVLRDICVKKKYIEPNIIVSDTHHSILNQSHITSTELDGLIKTFPLYVHFDKSLWEDIRRAEKDDKDGKKIFNQLRDQYQKQVFNEDQDKKLLNYKKEKIQVEKFTQIEKFTQN